MVSRVQRTSAKKIMAGISLLKAHLAKSSFADPLITLGDVEAYLKRCYPSLAIEDMRLTQGITKRWVIISCSNYTEVTGAKFGPIKPARVVFSEDGTYSLEVLFMSIGNGSWISSEPPHSKIVSLLDTLLASSGYILCPGICSYEKDFAETVRFKSKNLRIWHYPTGRYDSDQCYLWHKLSNLETSPTSPLFDLCSNCKTLHHDLSILKKRAAEASPGHKEKWTEPSSTRPLKYLSPSSKSKKLEKKGKEVKKLRKAPQKCDNSQFDIYLSSEQDDELQQLVNAIDKNGQSDLDAIFQEAESSGEGCGEKLHEIWEINVFD